MAKDLSKAKLNALIGVLVTLNTLLLGNELNPPITPPSTGWGMEVKVVDVIDGDTFVASNKQRVRLLSVNAPELDYCLGQEAKGKLTDLLLNKQVLLDDIRADKYGRLLALVYVDNSVLANKVMLENGLARFDGTKSQKRDVLKKSYDKAREGKIGLFDKCYQEYPENEKCSIKGNIDKTTGKKMYHFPGCREYVTTVIELDLGEAWFCSEKEAVEAGYVKSKQCFGKVYRVN